MNLRIFDNTHVMCHPIQHHAHIQTSMTMPPDPTLFLAHCKAHKTPRHSQPCKEQKMPTHSPLTPTLDMVEKMKIGGDTILAMVARNLKMLLKYMSSTEFITI